MPRLSYRKLGAASRRQWVVMSCDGLQSQGQTLTVVVVLCLLRLNELRDCLANFVVVWLLCYLRHTQQALHLLLAIRPGRRKERQQRWPNIVILLVTCKALPLGERV